MKKWLPFCLIVFFVIFGEKKESKIYPNASNFLNDDVKYPKDRLNSFFKNALISDKISNINRKNPIKILKYNLAKNQIKTDYPNLEELLIKGLDNQQWFITQNGEASTLIEIIDVNINTGWITLGKTFFGTLEINKTIEFFNPFVNYKIINNFPLFNPYPYKASEEVFNYIHPGGIIKKSDKTYVLLTPVVFGAHSKRSIYYATSNNLEDWIFCNKKLLSTDMIPFAKNKGNVFSTDNPYPLENGNYLVLLGVQLPNNNYTSAYMIIDEDLAIIQKPKRINLLGWDDENQSNFPLAITKFKGQYRFLFHKRKPSSIDREVHEVIVTNLFDALNSNIGIQSTKLLHKGSNSRGYLRGKADDATYLNFNSRLYVLLGSEEVNSNYLTSRNREYGLMMLENDVWKHDSRSPLIINPINLYRKFPVYNWAWDHLGGFISPIIENETLYIYLAFGADNPDYFISGIKIPLQL